MEGVGAEGPRRGTGGASRGGLCIDIVIGQQSCYVIFARALHVGQVFHDGTMHSMQQLGGTGSCDCFLHSFTCGDEVPETLVMHYTNQVCTLKKSGQFGHVVVRRNVPEPHIILEQLRSRTRAMLCCERARRSCSHMACAHIQLPPSSTLLFLHHSGKVSVVAEALRALSQTLCGETLVQVAE